jgi:hypothetical protein
MRRLGSAVPAAAMVCLLVPGVARGATDKEPVSAGQSSAGPQLALKGSNGYGITVAGAGQRVSVTASKGLVSASYFVRGRASSQGIDARIGSFGRISVRFKPTGKIRREKPPKGCTGKPLRVRSGVFVGTIRFVGEKRYTSVSARRARGTLRPAPDWNCSRQRAQEKASETERVPGLSALVARTSGGSRVFTAMGIDLFESKEDGLAFFIAGLEERRGSVQITRFGMAFGEAVGFSIDEAQTRATVRPPRPFRGEATFLRNDDGSTSWSGSLRVFLPGADGVSLTGPSFDTSLDKPKTFGQFAKLLTGAS